MPKSIAWALSIVFHPLLLLNALAVLLLFFASINGTVFSNEQIWGLSRFIFLITFLVPAFFIGVLKMFKLVSAYSLPNKEERTIPYLFSAVAIFYAAQMLPIYRHQPLLILWLYSAGIGLIFIILINLKWKISAHGSAWGGAIGFLGLLPFLNIPNSFLYLGIGIIACGLTLSARLVLKAHQPAQIYAGFVLGLCISLTIILINLKQIF